MTSTLAPDRPVDPFPAPPPASAEVPAPGRRGVSRLWRGPDGDPRWARPALLGLLAATAVLYLWGLGESGWANAYYSAAAQAGADSWKAFFYGASDAAASITVDKTPASVWVMALSVRVFGLSSWSLLVPQALMGVASVGILYASVKRWFGAGAGLLAGAVLALTPVATLMFRFDNPDALLVLALTAAAYCLTRALEKAGTRWVVAAFALVGLAFMAKMLQAFLVLPAFGLVYLLAAPTTFGRRVRDLALGAVALLVSGGWWIAVVELVPASVRPWVGGSQENSVLELLFGYNGLGRLTGDETGSVGGGGPGGANGGMWGPTGWTRMFNDSFGAQASWLLPAALLLLAAGLVVTWRSPRTDRERAAYGIWGGWLVVTVAVFSLGEGIIHEYYTVALAPAIGALVGIGASRWWARREEPAGRALLAGTVAVSTAWAATLLARVPDWTPWLRPFVLVTGLLSAGVILFAPHLRGRVGAAVAAAALVAVLAGPAAYSLQTASTPHTGSLPTAGPGGRGGPGGGFPGGGPGGGFPGGPGATGQGPGGGGPGGLLDASTPSEELRAVLTEDAGDFTWVAATVGAQSASGYQLATGESVMPIGGFNGSDPSPTLEEFQALVADGDIHWFIGVGGFGPGMGVGSSTSSRISEWVQENFTPTTVDGTMLYDLTSPLDR